MDIIVQKKNLEVTMGRPQRNNVDYFPFYCDEGTKMYYIEETYGNDGFATFIKLLRELAKADYHYLDLSKKTTLMFLSAKCKVGVETLKSIVSDLVELEKFDKELWTENSIIWCQDFIDSIQDAYSKRSNNCINKKQLLELLISLGVRKPPKGNPKPSKQPTKGGINPQSKVEYTKVEYTKVDESKIEVFDLWIEYRKEINKPIKSEKTLDSLAEKFNDNSLDKCRQVVNASISNGWQGLFWDKGQEKEKDNFSISKIEV